MNECFTAGLSDTVVRHIDTALVERYQRDGAVCVRNIIGSHWLSVLAAGVERNLANPGRQARVYTRDRGDAQGFFFGDVAAWASNPEYQDFLFNSLVSEIGARLTGARQINLYFDGVFIRSRHTPSRTPWHQDVPYWPIEGDQLCTVWIPLDPVPREGSVEYVKGSHLWGRRFRPKSFFQANEDYDFEGDELEPMPDFEALRDHYELLGWDMQPGDVQCFHGHIIHGAAGNDTDIPRRTFQARLAGDGMRYVHRDGEMHPTFPDCGLEPGDAIGGPSFPVLWRCDTGLVSSTSSEPH